MVFHPTRVAGWACWQRTGSLIEALRMHATRAACQACIVTRHMNMNEDGRLAAIPSLLTGGSPMAAWFKRRPRYHLHFTSTSGSWLNQVERWFAKITEQRLRRSAFRSVDDLEQSRPSASISKSTTRIRRRSSGPPPPISSSARSKHSAHGLIAQDIRDKAANSPK